MWSCNIQLAYRKAKCYSEICCLHIRFVNNFRHTQFELTSLLLQPLWWDVAFTLATVFAGRLTFMCSICIGSFCSLTRFFFCCGEKTMRI